MRQLLAHAVQATQFLAADPSPTGPGVAQGSNSSDLVAWLCAGIVVLLAVGVYINVWRGKTRR